MKNFRFRLLLYYYHKTIFIISFYIYFIYSIIILYILNYLLVYFNILEFDILGLDFKLFASLF